MGRTAVSVARPPLRAVKLDQLRQRHVAEAVAVGEQEFVVGNVRQRAPHAAAGLRGQAGVEQRDLPVLLGMLVVVGDLRRGRRGAASRRCDATGS